MVTLLELRRGDVVVRQSGDAATGDAAALAAESIGNIATRKLQYQAAPHMPDDPSRHGRTAWVQESQELTRNLLEGSEGSTRNLLVAVRGLPNVGLQLAAPQRAAPVDWSNPADLHGKVLDVATGELLDYDTFFARLRSARVLYISESHDNPAHHALQLRILNQLTAEGRHVTTVMEFLYRSQQPLIDTYLRGEVDQETFEAQVRHGFGALFHQYRDLLRAAGASGNRIVGMNVERAIKHRYLDLGWEGLSPAEQRLIPRELDLSNPDYRAYLRRVIEESHGSLEGLPEPMIERFTRLQALWDETFGETIANVVRDDPHTTALVVVGNAHVRHKFTTPEKAFRRAPAPYLTVVPIETDATRPVSLEAVRRSRIADFIFFTDFPPSSTRGLRADEAQ